MYLSLVSRSGPGSHIRPWSQKSIAVQIGFNGWASMHSLAVAFLDEPVIWDRTSLRATNMYKPVDLCGLVETRVNRPVLTASLDSLRTGQGDGAFSA